MFMPVSAFLLFLISEVEFGEECIFWPIFCVQILPQLEYFFQNLSAHIILIVDTAFMPNFTFLGIFCPEISFREK